MVSLIVTLYERENRMMDNTLFDNVKNLGLNDEAEEYDKDCLSLDDSYLNPSASPEYIKENIFKLNLENLNDSVIDKDKFQFGVNDVSYLCGAISALVSVGITPNKAMDYIIEKEAADAAMKHNLEILNIQKETSVETARLNLVSNADSAFKY